MSNNEGLVYVGRVVEKQDIPGADFICCATVICGKGGKWKGIVRKADFDIGTECLVYLPDAQIPEDYPGMGFMKSSGWRVKMRKFKGAPSEVVITRFPVSMPLYPTIGDDVTSWVGVTKYNKPVPANLQGIAKGFFPSFVPKTDELNYQRHYELVERLRGKPYYITEKADGSSTTAFKYKGQFGLCSRNLELEETENNGFWQVCNRYALKDTLPEGYALQWETCGPGIQKNPMGLKQLEGFAFSGYNINEQRYLELDEFLNLCKQLNFPRCKIISIGQVFLDTDLEFLGEGTYDNGSQREGVVVRSQHNVNGNHPISFKVINLNYE